MWLNSNFKSRMFKFVRCIPNALSEIDSGTESAIRASRGAVRMPFPILSTILTINASNHPLDKTKNGLLAVERAYPDKLLSQYPIKKLLINNLIS
jgi:hypothetical protein